MMLNLTNFLSSQYAGGRADLQRSNHAVYPVLSLCCKGAPCRTQLQVPWFKRTIQGISIARVCAWTGQKQPGKAPRPVQGLSDGLALQQREV